VTVVMSASGLSQLPRLVPSALNEPDHAAEAFAAVSSGQLTDAPAGLGESPDSSASFGVPPRPAVQDP